eukprot:1794519-Amphidinium_carterae.1
MGGLLVKGFVVTLKLTAMSMDVTFKRGLFVGLLHKTPIAWDVSLSREIKAKQFLTYGTASGPSVFLVV